MICKPAPACADLSDAAVTAATTGTAAAGIKSCTAAAAAGACTNAAYVAMKMTANCCVSCKKAAAVAKAAQAAKDAAAKAACAKANKGAPKSGSTVCIGCVNGYKGAKCDVKTYFMAYGATLKAGNAFCPAGWTAIMDKATCDAAYAALSGKKVGSNVGKWGDWPVGCFFGYMHQAHNFFNTGGTTDFTKLGSGPKSSKGGAVCTPKASCADISDAVMTAATAGTAAAGIKTCTAAAAAGACTNTAYAVMKMTVNCCVTCKKVAAAAAWRR